MKGRDEKAQQALARVLGQPADSSAVHEEYAEIASNLHHERAIGATSYLDCFKSGAGRNALRVWTGIALQGLQQLTGIVSRRDMLFRVDSILNLCFFAELHLLSVPAYQISLKNTLTREHRLRNSILPEFWYR